MMQHRFGGRWTDAKLAALREYLASYTTALKAKGFTLTYIDGFAGSGTYVPKSGASERKGSAQIALDTPGFDQYFFIEKNARRQAHLVAHCASNPKCFVFGGDANDQLHLICNNMRSSKARAVLFLDPYGLHVEWSTLERVARTQRIDVWYLFPLSGITRQMARDANKLDEDKAKALDRVLGTQAWRTEFYRQPPQADLFSAMASDQRYADTKVISEWVTQRLKTLFPVVRNPIHLRLNRTGRPGHGPVLFALYFAVSSRNDKAQSLALRIAEGVETKLRREGTID